MGYGEVWFFQGEGFVVLCGTVRIGGLWRDEGFMDGYGEPVCGGA